MYFQGAQAYAPYFSEITSVKSIFVYILDKGGMTVNLY